MTRLSSGSQLCSSLAHPMGDGLVNAAVRLQAAWRGYRTRCSVLHSARREFEHIVRSLDGDDTAVHWRALTVPCKPAVVPEHLQTANDEYEERSVRVHDGNETHPMEKESAPDDDSHALAEEQSSRGSESENNAPLLQSSSHDDEEGAALRISSKLMGDSERHSEADESIHEMHANVEDLEDAASEGLSKSHKDEVIGDDVTAHDAHGDGRYNAEGSHRARHEAADPRNADFQEQTSTSEQPPDTDNGSDDLHDADFSSGSANHSSLSSEDMTEEEMLAKRAQLVRELEWTQSALASRRSLLRKSTVAKW